jgi:hypothetical protein
MNLQRHDQDIRTQFQSPVFSGNTLSSISHLRSNARCGRVVTNRQLQAKPYCCCCCCCLLGLLLPLLLLLLLPLLLLLSGNKPQLAATQ